MQSLDGVGAKLHHNNGLIVFVMPRGGLVDHMIGDRVQFARIGVPTVVPIEANDVHMLTLLQIKTIYYPTTSVSATKTSNTLPLFHCQSVSQSQQ